MSKILCCGNATLDIINHVPHYPQEDEEMRATRQERHSGGNAANTALVLSQHGHDVSFVGTFACDTDGDWLLKQMQRSGIDIAGVVRHQGSTPTSCITLNTLNGSRTIVHHRDLNELNGEELGRIKPSQSDWLHFEGRNITELIQLIPALANRQRKYRISLEVEKHRPGIQELLIHADTVMFSRVYAEHQGYTNPEAFLSALQIKLPEKLMTCTWGTDGVWYYHKNAIRHVPAVSGITVVDTIGAGDTFNAGLIHSLLGQPDVHQAVSYANRLAGRKIAQQGLHHLF